MKIKRTNGYASISVDLDDPETYREFKQKHRELVQFFEDMKAKQKENKEEEVND